MRQNWLQAYDFATPRGAQFLSDYARSANPFQASGERTISVEVTSVLRASDRSFQVKWTETPFDHGVRGVASHWSGILTILIRPPTTTEVLRRNPLGLYIEAVDWSREIEDPPNRVSALSPSITAASPTFPSREIRP
jgi:type IV secretion system protein VirB5